MEKIASQIVNILNSAKNGWLYGSRLRLAHSFTLLVILGKIHNSTDLKRLLIKVVKNSQYHGVSLAMFAGLYKSLVLMLNSKINVTAKPSANIHFLAAFVAGYAVFGNQIPAFSNGISQQITLYIFARVILGGSRLLSEKLTQKIYESPAKAKLVQHKLNDSVWNLVAALSWGSVMVLWNFRKDVLNFSMSQSMDYIYSDTLSG